MPKCIYCKKFKRATMFNREHVIPQSFGTFGNNTPTLLKRVCESCNTYFNLNLDAILSRQTIEGITRISNGLRSSEPVYSEGPRVIIQLPLNPADPWEGTYIRLNQQTGLIEPLQQIHLKNKNTNSWEIFLKDKWGEIVWENYNGVKAIAPNDDLIRETIEVLTQHGMDQYSPMPHPQTNGEDVLIEVETMIDKLIKRALCKILFNFAIFNLGINEIIKPKWNKVRRFVRYGFGDCDFQIENNGFWGEETEHMRFEPNGINLRIQNRDNDVIGEIEFYNKIHYCFKIINSYNLRNEQECAYRFIRGEAPLNAIPYRGNLLLPYYR